MERKLTIRSPFNVFDGEQSQEERFSILKDTLQSRLALSLSLGHDVGLSTCAVVKLPLIRSRSPPSSTSSSSSSSSSPTSPSYHDPAESIRSIPSYHQHQNSASLTLLVTSSASSLSHLTRSARLPSLPAHLSLSLSLPILALSLLLSSPSQLVQPSPVHISVALQPLIGGSPQLILKLNKHKHKHTLTHTNPGPSLAQPVSSRAIDPELEPVNSVKKQPRLRVRDPQSSSIDSSSDQP
ncbi:hypothetical protein PGTUg99_016713 [Puccinia graminis f. sp. tritici]|uniref:Uncharacterized protein n=1 Tax=Puccinia graminis f. sp. tritici TaxID=56615 RepID=A0A5B0NIP6_PUCGR|nr:hypothetical protein PGTUg99_016713 [Puccinia graminis f. sp. tritici]